MSFFAELKRRNVIRMAGLYLVGAWLLIQIAETLLPAFDVPGWVLRAVIILLALGFIPALIFSWVFELTPDGVKRDSEIAALRSIAPQTARRMDRLIITGLVLVVAVIAADRFWPRDAAQSAPAAMTDATSASSQAAADAGPAHSAISNKSIAVLAFANMSADPENEYFSDGISEEILNALAKVRDLKVAGRTSSFHFKGRNEDLRAIGETLGVAHVLEGSVRRQGDKVRITAQLVRAADGFRVWSESYDGDLVDVFELQERIARAITDELKIVLQGEQSSRLVTVDTRNAQAFDLFLQATAVFNQRDATRFQQALGMLEEAVSLDPSFARGWSRLAAMYALAMTYTGMAVDEALIKARRSAERAIAIDPQLAEPYAALGQAYFSQRRYVEARPLLERAVALDPSDITAQFWFGTHLVKTGYTAQATQQLDLTLRVDPLLPNGLTWRAELYLQAGDREAAREMLEQAISGGLAHAEMLMADIAQQEGRPDAAIGHYARGLSAFPLELPEGAEQILAQGIFGAAAERPRALAMIDTYLGGNPQPVEGIVPRALLRLDQPARALAMFAQAATSNDAQFSIGLWAADGADARQLPQFADFARKVGLAALWDRYGPPDLCRKADNGDYVCE